MAHNGVSAKSSAIITSQNQGASSQSPDHQSPTGSLSAGGMPSRPGSEHMTDQEANARGNITIKGVHSESLHD